MNTSPTIGKIAVALLQAQKNMGAAVKDAKNPFFKSKFADLNAVREASHPALNAAGITVLQPTGSNEHGMFVSTLLLHESGEFISSETAIICAKQNDPQALGSAISYARRYGLQSLVSLGSQDDDGEGAMNRPGNKTVVPQLTVAASILNTENPNGTNITTKEVPSTKTNGSFKKAQAPKAVLAPASVTNEDTGWD